MIEVYSTAPATEMVLDLNTGVFSVAPTQPTGPVRLIDIPANTAATPGTTRSNAQDTPSDTPDTGEVAQLSTTKKILLGLGAVLLVGTAVYVIKKRKKGAKVNGVKRTTSRKPAKRRSTKRKTAKK